uniref:Uncharacterized protein n=1 Tax=Avena sativa TaxID=4498 RepID=A0ACD5WFR2_AVESA
MEANGGGGGLEDGGGGHALANGGGQAAAMEEAGGAVGNEGLQVMVAPNGVVPAQAVGPANPEAMFEVFLRLPVQEIARCRMVCSLWRDLTSTENFRLTHHGHLQRTPMPLIFCFNDPALSCIHLRAVDVRDSVSRPLMRFPLHHEPWRIHGSCAGVLLLSSGDRLYACNPCTRRWARLPPLHVHNHIIGFYLNGIYGHEGFGFEVLFHNRQEPDCDYWIFQLAGEDPQPIGRPGPEDEDDVHLDNVLADGVAPSYEIPPVHVLVFLCWMPQATRDNSDILMFDTTAESFSLIPPPIIQVDGEDIPVGVGGQLFAMGNHLAMAVISPESVDVWVRNGMAVLWVHHYRIPLQVGVDVINLNGDYHQNGVITDVFAVARDRSHSVQCPRIMLVHHQIVHSRHTIEESLLLHPNILPMQDTDAVDGNPLFFQNQ